MASTLYLVRHGIAGPPEGDGGDAERELTAVGERRMRRIARALECLGVEVDTLFSSPLRRAEQTARVLAPAVLRAGEVEISAALAPGIAAAATVEALRRLRSGRRVMLVGHQPGLGELASYLLSGSVDSLSLPFRKGAVAAIEVGSLTHPSSAELLWFLTPKQLRLLGRRR